MESVVRFILILIACYLLGSIPSSFIMGRMLRGIDLRQHGSGNLGAANTFRVLGAKAAVPVLLFDIGKGFLAVKIASMFGVSGIFQLLIGTLVVIMGHNYSIFVRFSGGKGVGTTAGAFLALAPVAVGICFVIWGLLLLMFRIVSIASMISVLFLPLIIILENHFLESGIHDYVVIMSVIMAALVIYKHRSNIKRLSKGTEPKIF